MKAIQQLFLKLLRQPFVQPKRRVVITEPPFQPVREKHIQQELPLRFDR
jgi:hypothetical protein